MSGTTFSTYPVSSQSATQAAPRSDAAHAASLEQSYLSAAQRSAPPVPVAASQNQGPVTTTLALGEEDGGGMGAMPGTGSMPPQGAGGDFQVTTLAIGEEDGGAMGGGYGTMSPIRDDHSTIGGHVGGDPVGGYSTPAPHGIQQDGYGGMQPIYSPGEAEYPAFARTSQTPDLLNFHPVARMPKAALPQSMPVAAPAPVAVTAPAVAQPIQASPMPVGALAQDVPQSGSYESVGSYEEYVGAVTSAPMEAMPPAGQYIETTPAYQPATPATEPVMEAAPAEQAYETYQPAYESIGASQAAPSYDPAPATYAPEPVPAYEPVGAYEAAPAAAPVAPAATYAPTTSAEPRHKPSLFGKDAPLDYAGSVEAVDPADGNPGYVAPSGGMADAPAAEPAPAPAEPEATYVQVSIDDYLVEATGGQDAASAPVAPSDVAPASAEPATASVATSEPAPVSAPVPSDTAPPPPAMSLGGSYVVIDTPPASPGGVSSGAGSAGPDAPGDPAEEGLRIMTLAIGEEAGSQ